LNLLDPETTMFNEQTLLHQDMECSERSTVLGLKGGYGGISKLKLNEFEETITKLSAKKPKIRTGKWSKMLKDRLER
jgi:hypothetical protein